MKYSISNIGLFLSFLLASCGLPSQPADIVVTVFAHYDLTRTLVSGTELNVKFPITPGQDVHDWQPSAQDIQSFYDASLVIFNGLDLEPWSDNLLSQSEFKADVIILEDYVDLIEGHDHEDHAISFEPLGAEDDHAYDPHFWLDPHNAKLIVVAIQSKIIELFPETANLVNTNAAQLIDDLEHLETSFELLLNDNHHDEVDEDVHEHTTLIFAGHNAFSYLMNYGLEFVTPYEGFSPSSSPTASQIAALTILLESMEEPIIYASLLEGLAIAEVLKEQFLDLEIFYLSTLENVTSSEIETATYFSLMNQNLDQINNAIHHD
jgi:zinc transport system substrate-binding protein